MGYEARKDGKRDAFAGATRADAFEQCPYDYVPNRMDYVRGFLTEVAVLDEIAKEEKAKEEVALNIDGESHVLKLTLGSLAELESHLETGGLVELIERFETGAFSIRDVLHLIVAGLRGGGWQGQNSDLMDAEIAGGPIAAAKVAAQLLVAVAAAAMEPETRGTETAP